MRQRLIQHADSATEQAPSDSCPLPNPLRRGVRTPNFRPIRSRFRWGTRRPQIPAVPPPRRGGGDVRADLRIHAVHHDGAGQPLPNFGVRIPDVHGGDVSFRRQRASARDFGPRNCWRTFSPHSRSPSRCYAYTW